MVSKVDKLANGARKESRRRCRHLENLIFFRGSSAEGWGKGALSNT